MYTRFTGRLARVASATLLAAILLPCLAGHAAAVIGTTPTVSAGGWPTQLLTTLRAKPTSAARTTISGNMVLIENTTYTWTLGLFNAAAASDTPFGRQGTLPWGAGEHIVTTEIKVQGGRYGWECTVTQSTSAPNYSGGCVLTAFVNIDPTDPVTYNLALPPFSVSQDLQVDFQTSFVATSRISDHGKTASSNPYSDPTQCTWGAAKQIDDHYHFYPPFKYPVPYAHDLYTVATNIGWSTSLYPQSNSVVVFQPGFGGAAKLDKYGNPGPGHVAWVSGIEFRLDGIYLHTTDKNVAILVGGNWVSPGKHYVYRIVKTNSTTTTPGINYVLPAA